MDTHRLVLLADSQLLFPGKYSGELHAVLQQWVSGRTGIYIGAANGDMPEYFQLAKEAFSALGATLVWQKGLQPVPDAAFCLLAGGDVAQGWRYISHPAIFAGLQRAHRNDALFIGVSAGAMHLAHAFNAAASSPTAYLGWLPAIIAVHEEREGWPTLKHYREAPHGRSSSVLPLLTVPMGGGLVVADGQLWQTGKGGGWHTHDAPPQSLPWLGSGCVPQLDQHHGP